MIRDLDDTFTWALWIEGVAILGLCGTYRASAAEPIPLLAMLCLTAIPPCPRKPDICGRQEYFPRALILQMEMDEEEEAPSEISSPPIGCDHERPKVCKPLHHDWVERTVILLDQILQTWERRMEDRSPSQPLHASNTEPSSKATENNSRGPSAVMVAEAVLNSAHCCVTAISTCIGQDPMVYSILAPSFQSFSSSGRDGDRHDQQRRVDVPAGGVSGCQHTRAGMSKPNQRIGLAFDFVGRILTTAAKVEPIKEALVRRALGLLVNPTRQD